MGSLPRFVRSLLEFVGFVAWVCRLGSLVRGFVDWVCVVSAWVCVCVRVGLPLFLLCPLFVDFFSKGSKGRRRREIGFLAFPCGNLVFKIQVPSEFSLKSSI